MHQNRSNLCPTSFCLDTPQQHLHTTAPQLHRDPRLPTFVQPFCPHNLRIEQRFLLGGSFLLCTLAAIAVAPNSCLRMITILASRRVTYFAAATTLDYKGV